MSKYAMKWSGKLFFRGLVLAAAVVWMAVGGQTTFGQSKSAADSSSSKALAFDVVSVRLVNPVSGQRPGQQQFGPTPDGYRMTNSPLILAIMTAYVPKAGDDTLFTNNIVGMPDWTQGEHYDINAKVSEADLAEWQKPAAQPAMLRAMLQAMLADRFKLTVHREMKDVSVYSLVVGKSGPRFKETPPGEPHPGAMAIPGGGGFMAPGDGGQKVQFYGTTISTMASLLSTLAGRPIEDKTGLTGRYDFTFQKPAPMASPSAGQDMADPGPTIFSAMGELGLKLEPAKGQVETLVIDHIEKPSEN